MSQISQKAKHQFWNGTGQRDGENCLYCQKPRCNVLDHLNDNRDDNRLENLVRSHQHCNIAKIHNIDYRLIAHDKLRENEQAIFIPTEDNTSEESSTEIKISKTNFEIIEQYLSEKILTDGFVTWHDALYGATYKCKKLTGYGSVQCTRNYLYILTSPEAPFMKTKDKNKKSIIVRRNQN